MKQYKLVQAYKAIGKLYNQDFPLADGYKLFKLKKQLKPAFDFQIEQETKIFEEFKPTGVENGEVTFATSEAQQGAMKAMEDLRNMESDIEITPVKIPLIDGIQITPADLEVLDGDFIEFVEPEPKLEVI